MIPEEYKPLSPWAYFGYTILFSIPVVGLICLIVFSLASGNINRKNFARSYFCWLILIIIIWIILMLLNVSITDVIPKSSNISGIY